MPSPSREVVTDLAPTGVLRATINLGNPVLTNGTPDNPGGVTVAIARELASRLDVPLKLMCFDAARKSFSTMVEGDADITFLAIEPAREGDVRFSAPYLTVEGVFLVEQDSPLVTMEEVDRQRVRIGVKEGSAYDLFLTRTIEQAELVRGKDGIDVYVAEGLDAAAGIRQPLTAYVSENSAHRILEPAFMQIQQAVGIPRDRCDPSAAYVSSVLQDLLSTGYIRAELARAGQDPDLAID